MAATTAVFDTYELLENVIINLPPVDVTRVMRVAKAWQKLINQSKSAQAARVLVPLQKLAFWVPSPLGLPIEPTYDRKTDIQFHRRLLEAFSSMDKYSTADYSFLHIYSPEEFVINRQLHSIGDNFVTKPPSQAVGLRIWDSRVTVYVKGGIRVNDLQKVASGLIARAEKVSTVKLEDTLSSDPKDRTMAAQAVFDTYELVENIALDLHPFDIARLLRVSKTSYSVVKRSAAIRNARVLVPRQKLRLPVNTQKYWGEHPVYNAKSNIEFHRGMSKTTADIDARHWSYDNFYLKWLHTNKPRKFIKDWDLQQIKGHFATRPPCQAAGVRLAAIETIVYVKGGVRIRDLQDIVLALMRQTGEGHYGNCHLRFCVAEEQIAIRS